MGQQLNQQRPQLTLTEPSLLAKALHAPIYLLDVAGPARDKNCDKLPQSLSLFLSLAGITSTASNQVITMAKPIALLLLGLVAVCSFVAVQTASPQVRSLCIPQLDAHR